MALLSSDDLQRLRIGTLVLHEVGPKATDHKLFNGVIEPGEQERFFLDRLVAANEGSAYTFRADSALLGQLRRVQSDADALEVVGKEIAVAFQERHRRQSIAGTLVVFHLKSDDNSLFAVAKFDSQQVVAVSEEGDVHARLRLLQKTIVESKLAMQKSALVRLSKDGGSLAVLDRHSAERVPIYFQDFLGADRAFTEELLTKNLNDAIIEAARANREIIDQRVYQEIPTLAYRALSVRQPFDPDEDTVLTAVFGVLPPDSPIRQTFKQQLIDNKMEHEAFTPNPSALNEPARRKIRTVEGIRIIFGLNFSDNVKISDDGTKITITTAGIESDEQS